MSEQTTTALALKGAVGQSNGLLEKLLDALPPEATAELLSQATLRHVDAGETIVERGLRFDLIGYVLEGTLAMVQTFEDGKRHIMGFLVPTDVFGRLFDGPTNYRIEALSATRILLFPRAAFEQVLRAHPEAERLFLVHLLDEVDAARDWLLLISGRKVINRLASFLMILVRRSKFRRTGTPTVVHVPFARKDLAHYLGARPETLSRAFGELEGKGILRIVDPYHFEILDEGGLIEAAGENLIIENAKVAGPARRGPGR